MQPRILMTALVLIYAFTSGVAGYTSVSIFCQLEGTDWWVELPEKNSNSEFQAPCPTTKCLREVLSRRWYWGILLQMALAGILPFGSVWGHEIYTIYNILFIVFIFLLIATALVTVALTYIQLADKNHEW